METIKQFLQISNATAEFYVIAGGKKSQPITCSIKFLYVEIGTPHVRGFFFMPDYEATLDPAKCTLTFKPLKSYLTTITLQNNNLQILNNWFQFAENAPKSLEAFFPTFTESDLPTEQDLGHTTRPYIIKLSTEYVFTIVDSGQTIIYYQITSRTNIRLPKIDDPPQIGLYESSNPNKITYSMLPSLSSIYNWVLLLKLCVMIVDKKEKEQFENLEFEVIPVLPDEAIIKRQLKQQQQVQQQQQQEESQNSQNSPKFQNSQTNEDKISNQNSMQQIQQIDHKNRRRSSIRTSFDDQHKVRRLSHDAQTISQLNNEVMKQINQLQQKRNNYKKSVNISEPIPEPEIAPPKLTNYRKIISKSYEVVNFEKPQKMQFEDLMNMIEPQITNPSIRFKRYIPEYIYLNFKMQPIEYDEKSPENFENVFLNSQPKQTFVLLGAILSNGFIGQSFSELFQIQKQANRIYDTQMALNQHGQKIYDFILNIKEPEKYYEPWSIIVSGREMLNVFRDKAKPFDAPFPFPEFLPYQYPLKPFEYIQIWFNEILYSYKMGKCDSQLIFYNLAQLLWGLFNHYINDSVHLFIKEILSKIGAGSFLPPWSNLRKNDQQDQNFSKSWISFWISSFKEGKLSANFTEFFKYQTIIAKFYYKCSGMRNVPFVQFTAEMVNAISQLGLSTDFDVTIAGNDNKLLKNIAGLIGLRT